MKKLVILICIFFLTSVGNVFAADNRQLRDYDGLALGKGTFIPVISSQEISTAYYDVGTQVRFIATSDLYLFETNVVPQNTDFFGYVEKINEPIVGTNASMIIKISKMVLPDGFEIPLNGYIYTPNGNFIGGELTEPASFERKASYMQGFPSRVGYVPGPARKMGEHKVIASGADLMVILVAPLYITHTVTNWQKFNLE